MADISTKNRDDSVSLFALDRSDEFQMIDEDLFEASIEQNRFAETSTLPHNYCPDCKTPMTLNLSDYVCKRCGRVEYGAADGFKETDEASGASIRGARGGRSRHYTVPGAYSKTQHKSIVEQLRAAQVRYTANGGIAFRQNVLTAVANQYNRIQRHIVEETENEDGQTVKKKFVRRRTIKDEIIGALLYFECIRDGNVRKKKDIAGFMGLSADGFPRGENFVRALHAEQKIDIPINSEPIVGYTDRYLEALNIEKPNYEKFIDELVTLSETKKIGMTSQLSSKIVAAIYIIAAHCETKITIADIERACDNTRKNTFDKFAKVIMANMPVFMDVFIRNGIPTTPPTKHDQ